MADRKPKRSRGNRDWTPEQRKAASERMREMHAKSRSESRAKDKDKGLESLTVGQLLRFLQDVPEQTPIHFEASCVERPEIKPDSHFDNDGKLIVTAIVIR